MDINETTQLEEFGGLKFLVEYVSPIPNGSWFRVHTTSGITHNLTIGCTETKEDARQEVIKAFKDYLSGK